MPESRPSPFEALIGGPRVILVVGKGGVGKTTVARTLVEALEASGVRARRVELGVGAGAAPLEPGVERIGSDDAFLRAAEPIFGSRALVRAAFGHAAVSELLTVIPGLREYALLVVALGLADRSPPRDRVVIDMPATGHGLTWLSAARRLAVVAGSGRAHAQALALDRALRSRAETGLVLVTQCEPLILQETDELRASLRMTLDRDADLLVVNRVPPSLASHDEVEALAVLSNQAADPGRRAELERLRQWCAARDRTRELARTLLRGGAAVWIQDDHGARRRLVRSAPGLDLAEAA